MRFATRRLDSPPLFELVCGNGGAYAVAQIGIKLADGSFYPVLAEETPQRKRTVLSVAQADQGCAQIDIIRREDEADQYVGCLVLEDLQPDEGQELTLIIGIDRENNLEARVDDAAGKHYQSFVVALDQLDSVEHYSLPDDTPSEGLDPDSSGVFDIGSPEDVGDPDIGMPDIDMPEIDMPDLDDVEFDHGTLDDTVMDDTFMDDTVLDDTVLDEPADDATSYGFEDDGDLDDEYPDEAESRPFSPLVLIALILIVLSVLALGAYGVVRLMGGELAPELRAVLPLLLPVSVVPRLRR